MGSSLLPNQESKRVRLRLLPVRPFCYPGAMLLIQNIKGIQACALAASSAAKSLP